MKQRVLLVFCGLFLGVLIVATSFASAVTESSLGTLHQGVLSEDTSFFAVLPNKVEAIQDRLVLSIKDQAERPNEKLNIAEKRLQTAKIESDEGRVVFALETATKGQQYVAEVVLALENDPLCPVELKPEVSQILKSYVEFFSQLHPRVDDSQRKMIDRLLSENKALVVHLGM